MREGGRGRGRGGERECEAEIKRERERGERERAREKTSECADAPRGPWRRNTENAHRGAHASGGGRATPLGGSVGVDPPMGPPGATSPRGERRRESPECCSAERCSPECPLPSGCGVVCGVGGEGAFGVAGLNSGISCVLEGCRLRCATLARPQRHLVFSWGGCAAQALLPSVEGNPGPTAHYHRAAQGAGSGGGAKLARSTCRTLVEMQEAADRGGRRAEAARDEWREQPR